MAQLSRQQSDLKVLTLGALNLNIVSLRKLMLLDGGGVRGFSTLYLLAGLMRRVNEIRQKNGLDKIKPYQLFHLIVGTSTGGYDFMKDCAERC